MPLVVQLLPLPLLSLPMVVLGLALLLLAYRSEKQRPLEGSA